jgi:hypothetical protein
MTKCSFSLLNSQWIVPRGQRCLSEGNISLMRDCALGNLGTAAVKNRRESLDEKTGMIDIRES